MTSTRIIRIGLGLSLMLMAVAALGQKVKTDSAPGIAWSSYHTFVWGEGTPAKNPVFAKRIVSGIESHLAAKGLTKVEKDGDLVVIYHAATEKQETINTSSYGDWVGWDNRQGWSSPGAPGMGTAYVDTVILGELRVVIGDRHAKKFFWRGTANDAIRVEQKLDQKKVEKTIDKALDKMFKKFPPK